MQKRQWWYLAEFAFGGSLESEGWYYVGRFDKNLVSVATKMLSHLIYFLNLFSFNAICKDNATINCITVQHKRFIPVN
jgi:hypothetical protein